MCTVVIYRFLFKHRMNKITVNIKANTYTPYSLFIRGVPAIDWLMQVPT